MSALLLALLAAAALAVAAVPRWRRAFQWGRGPGSYPVSRLGCLGTALAFAVMAVGVAGASFGFLRPDVGFLVLLAGFCVFIVAGLLDRRAQRPRS